MIVSRENARDLYKLYRDNKAQGKDFVVSYQGQDLVIGFLKYLLRYLLTRMPDLPFDPEELA